MKQLIVAASLWSLTTVCGVADDGATPQKLPSWKPRGVLLAPDAVKNVSETQTSTSADQSPDEAQGSESRPQIQQTILQTVDSGEFEFTPLVNGDTLQGWHVQKGKPESWSVQNGIVSCVSTGGGWLRTEQRYSDFVLAFEYRLQEGGNSGVALRCPGTGNPSFTGMEIQLLDDDAPKYADLRPAQYTGSVYYRVAPQRRAVLRPPGEWNACEVRCIGDHIRVIINNETVNELLISKSSEDTRSAILARNPPVGHIALQSHATRVDFRNLKIHELTQVTETGLRYVDLIEGEGDAVTDVATVTVHYHGQLADGTRFEDSRELGNPVTVPLDSVIDGWREGITGMKPGGRRRLIVPPELAYGDDGVEDLIPPDATLYFEVELCRFDR